MTKRGLILLNAALWGFAGYKILSKGLPALLTNHSWWVVILCIVIAAGFLAMFRKVSGKYVTRIQNLEGTHFPFYKFMSVKGYILIAFMMSLGIIASRIPGMPEAFFAAFYPGLGSGLLLGSIRYLIAAAKQR